MMPFLAALRRQLSLNLLAVFDFAMDALVFASLRLAFVFFVGAFVFASLRLPSSSLLVPWSSPLFARSPEPFDRLGCLAG